MEICRQTHSQAGEGALLPQRERHGACLVAPCGLTGVWEASGLNTGTSVPRGICLCVTRTPLFLYQEGPGRDDPWGQRG